MKTWLISGPQDEPRCQLLSSPRLSQETSHANTDRDPSVLHIWSRDLNELNPTITFRPRLSFLGALTMGSDRFLRTIRAFPHSCPNERPELSDSVDSSSEAWQRPLTRMPAKLALGPQDEAVESLVTMSQVTSGVSRLWVNHLVSLSVVWRHQSLEAQSRRGKWSSTLSTSDQFPPFLFQCTGSVF